LWGFAAGAGPDLVEALKRVVGQVDVEGALAGGEPCSMLGDCGPP
jgi:hypothetical protein